MSQQESHLKQTFAKTGIKGLFGLLKGNGVGYSLAVVAIGLAALAEAGIYYVIAYFVDDMLPREGFVSQLPLVTAAIIGLAILQGTGAFISGRLAARSAESIVKNLRDYLYDHLQRLSFTYHDRMQTGELLQRATSDVETIRRLFSEQAIGIGRIALLFIVNFIALLLLDVRLALWSIVLIPIIILSSYMFFTVIGKRYEAFQEQEAVMSNRLQESLTGVRVVKAFARQDYERKRFDTENHAHYKAGNRLTFMHALYWPTTDIICGLQLAWGMWIAAQMVLSGTLTLGLFLAYTGFAIKLIWPIRNVGRILAEVSMSSVSFGRIADIVKVDREPLTANMQHPSSPPTGTISFRDVTFAYTGEETSALYNIDLDVEAGQTIALLGSTGSGKTSLVNLLPRFYDYTSGSITLDGVELAYLSRTYLRQNIGIVQQEPFLFALSIRDNITYGVNRDVSDEELFAATRAADVHDVILTFPDGYDTLVGERGVTLSGGQKQRVTLARTILQNPRILILDDATSAVDSETEEAIRDALVALEADRTTFIIAHRIQSVMHADQIVVMDQGRIIQRGTHRQLLADTEGVYRRIYELQASIEAELEAEILTVNGNGNGSAEYKNGQNGHAVPMIGD